MSFRIWIKMSLIEESLTMRLFPQVRENSLASYQNTSLFSEWRIKNYWASFEDVLRFQ
jgi:hypothetical protein